MCLLSMLIDNTAMYTSGTTEHCNKGMVNIIVCSCAVASTANTVILNTVVIENWRRACKSSSLFLIKVTVELISSKKSCNTIGRQLSQC